MTATQLNGDARDQEAPPDPARALEAAALALRSADELLDAARADQAKALAAVHSAFEIITKAGTNSLPIPSAPISEHRAEHRPGNQPKLDADPELRAFVMARLDRMTFQAITEDVAAAFPPERRVGRSAIHEWWQRRRRSRRRRRTPQDGPE